MEKMQASNYCVYKHTAPSGKVYIGITGQKPERRWRGGEGYKGTPFYNAILKYGWENISHEVLANGLSKEEACEMEIEAIREHESQDRERGYNVLAGGDVPLADCPASVREKMRVKSFEKWARDDYKQSHIGNEHWTHKNGYCEKSIEAMRQSNLGRKRTPEQVEFLREKGRKQKRLRGKDNKKSIPILCISKDGDVVGKFFGAMEAERETGVCFQNIFKVCNGERKSAGGFVWRYAEEENNGE